MIVDPILQRIIRVAYRNGFANIHTFSAEKMRKYLVPPKLKVQKASYQDFKSNLNLTIRSYCPSSLSSNEYCPAVFYLPASAYVLDRLDTCNDYCSLLANTLQMKIINCLQRLPPEFKYPCYLEDCIEHIQWIYHHADELKIDANKIAIWGESSGGNIAAGATHLLRDMGLHLIQHQTLFYPMVDLVNDYPSKTLYQQGYLLDKTFIEWIKDRVLLPSQNRGDPKISPLLFSSFKNLPPATIITAELDPLRDEGEAYALKLQKADIPINFKRFENLIHGFMTYYGKITATIDALTFASNALKRAFSPTPLFSISE